MSIAKVIDQIVASTVREMETAGASVSYNPAKDKIRVDGISGLDAKLIVKWRSLVSDHRSRIVNLLLDRSRAAEKSAHEAAQRARAAAEIQALNKLDADNYLLPTATRSYMQAVHRVVKRDQEYLDRLLDKRAAEQRAHNERLEAEIDRLLSEDKRRQTR